jgi:hypothetical protein
LADPEGRLEHPRLVLSKVMIRVENVLTQLRFGDLGVLSSG